LKALLAITLVCVLSGIAGAAIIVSEDFEDPEWPTGTINAGYTLPAGWVNVVDGMQIVTSQNHTPAGTKSLYSSGGSTASVRVEWTPHDPLDTDTFAVTFWMYKAPNNQRVEKGAALFSQWTVDGTCAPQIQWYCNTSNSLLYRIRDRRNCGVTSPPDPPSGLDYLTVQNLEFPQDWVAWHEWKAVCQASAPGIELFKDGASLHGGTNTYGAPNDVATPHFDNWRSIEFGRCQTAVFSDHSGNGEVWYDDIVIERPMVAVDDWAAY